NGSNFTLIRSRIDTLEGANSCLGGIGVMAHEFAHVTPNLKWGHTNSGRYCIMDFIDVHDRNCPQHPSPFLKIQEGWLTPIALEHTQSGAVIPPVETSHQVGIVTVYGKPTAYPDIQTGEYYILENRRLLGFDRKVVESHSLNFKGGLLLWHYSPYNRVVPYSDKSGAEQRVQLRAPYYKEIVDTNIFYGDSVYLAGSHGEEKHFFAWKLDIDSANYYYYDSSRTYSTFNLKTGLALNNITNDYTNILGNITLDINYKICDPPNYSYVMRSDGTSNQTYDFSGNIFIHNSNMENKYIFREGSAIDVINGFSLKAE
ncbi:MAG: hypothetical protein NTU73_06955, partial [Ignavibacteriae bacterium]|nr:hypothetical protein [Ignavibacteriota bacterium]